MSLLLHWISAIALLILLISPSFSGSPSKAPDTILIETLERLAERDLHEEMRRLPYGHTPEGIRNQQRIPHAAETRAAINATRLGARLFDYGIGLAENARVLREVWEPLSDTDNEFDPDFDNSGPTVPSYCAESEECLVCYQNALREINFNRFYIERARAITVSNIRFADAAKSFGDSSSSIHGIAGLAWQLQGKTQIVGAVEQLRKTYREKAEIYLRNLEQALQQLGKCEEDYYGERDWYQRHGYLYIQFMRAKYQGAAD